MDDAAPIYAPLLASTRAEDRAAGIARWEEHHGDAAALVALLDDDAPLVRAHAGGRWVVEVRALALVALEDRLRRTRQPWPYGPVKVRAGMPEAEVERRCAGLAADRRAKLDADAVAALAARVRPPDADAALCRGYLALKGAGEVGYAVQDVDPDTLLTPLQADVHRSQLASPRPVPHVRFDGPDGAPVGFLYRGQAGWVLDVDEGPLARTVRDLVGEWRRAGKGGVPRVLFDDAGAPRLHPSGQGLATDGIVPADTDQPLDYLQSVAAFIGQRHRATVVV